MNAITQTNLMAKLNAGNGVYEKFAAGNGVQDIEGRIAAIETRIRTLQQMTGAAKTPFASYLNGTEEAPEVTGTMSERKAALQPAVEELADRYGVDKSLVNAVIRQESGFNPNAVSSAGAQGLMQLMPATAKSLGVANPKDAMQNLEGGVKHLSSLLAHYNGNIPLALAAYNAGMGAVKKYGGIPPYKETQNYVKSILAQYLRDKNGTV